MHVDWTWAAAGIVTFAVAFPTAILVFSAAPHQRQNRYLALVLLLVALYSIETLQYLTHDLRLALNLKSAANPPWIATPFAYLLFLSTVPSPLTRPLRPRPIQAALLGLTFLPFLAWPWIGDHFVLSDPAWPGWTDGPLYRPLELTIAGVLIFGLLVAIDNLRRTRRDSPLRPQAVAYLAAFGARDLILSASLLIYPIFARHGSAAWLYPASWTGDILFALLITYGALKTRLFDIDLKIKWTINRSTIVGTFLAVFFIVSVTAENFLTDRYGWAIGGTGAGLLLFALTPLQRLADRVSNKAMPHVHDTEEYRTVRKLEVYRAALQSALEDGAVTDKERSMLATLADQLGISAKQALDLERSVAAPAE